MQERYFRTKADLPANTILLLRLGDFYEVFGDDAVIAAKAANVALTKRGELKMCGFPYHAIHKYAEALAQAGHAVAFDEGTHAKP